MDGIKILHTGDLHLGMSFTGSKLTPAMGRIRRQELWETFDRIIDITKKERIDILLIAGDLFEYTSCTLSDIKRINARFARVPDTYVLITPGNHDPALPDSFYNTYQWEPNVHIFRENKVRPFKIKGLNTTVWGIGWERGYIKDALLEGFKVKEDGINILMAHCDVISKGGSSKYLPVYPGDLAACGAHYIALGHIHGSKEIKHGGKGVAFYCGSPEPLDFSEGGCHGVYMGTMGTGFCDIEFLPLAKREFIIKEIIADSTGDTAVVIDAMERQIFEHGKNNIFRFLLKGSTDAGVKFDTAYLEQRVKAFYVEVKNDTYPGYDLDALIKDEQKSIVGIFTAKLLEQLDHERDPDKKAILERALYIGLDALEGRKVISR